MHGRRSSIKLALGSRISFSCCLRWYRRIGRKCTLVSGITRQALRVVSHNECITPGMRIANIKFAPLYFILQHAYKRNCLMTILVLSFTQFSMMPMGKPRHKWMVFCVLPSPSMVKCTKGGCRRVQSHHPRVGKRKGDITTKLRNVWYFSYISRFLASSHSHLQSLFNPIQ